MKSSLGTCDKLDTQERELVLEPCRTYLEVFCRFVVRLKQPPILEPTVTVALDPYFPSRPLLVASLAGPWTAFSVLS